jgi:hypothetical protein
MCVYVGIDVHRKRSQVAVTGQSGEVLANRNVPDGAEPILKVIGGLPPGTPAAVEACYGTSWLVQLLEDYGFDPHLVHPSRCKAIASARGDALVPDDGDRLLLGEPGQAIGDRLGYAEDVAVCGVQVRRPGFVNRGEAARAAGILLPVCEEPVQQSALVHDLDAARVQAERADRLARLRVLLQHEHVHVV